MSSKIMHMEVEEDADDPDPIDEQPNDESENTNCNHSEDTQQKPHAEENKVESVEPSEKPEELPPKANHAEEDAEPIVIINLDDDDDITPVIQSKRRLGDCVNVKSVVDLVNEVAGNSKCINVSCKGNENLRRCPGMCLSYYRVRSKSIKYEICDVCYEEAFQQYDKEADLLMRKEILFEYDLPARNELLTISDSDEEVEEENMSVESAQFMVDNLIDVFKDIYKKCDVKAQIDNNIEHLRKKVQNVTESVEEVDTMYSSIQKRLDATRKEFYSPFQVKYNCEPSIEIIDDASIPKTPTKLQPILPKPTAAAAAAVSAAGARRSKAERRSSRNIAKPATYSELEFENTPSPPVVQSADVVLPTSKETELPNVDTIVPFHPPKGALQRPCPQVGELFYAGKIYTLTAWNKASVLEVFPPDSIVNDKTTKRVTYRIKMENKQRVGINRFVGGQELAYITPSPVRLDVGTRVIALFKDTTVIAKKEAYFPGIVAEPLLDSNNHRYLIFFDDGYAQYVTHLNVRVIIEYSKNVWEDVHMDSRQFIKKYLESYPERPMVKLQQGQVVRTEWNGKWLLASVLKVEGSLVQMYFEADARSEWIYRGSTRLNPMFREEQAACNRQERRRAFTEFKSPQQMKNMPYVQYTRTDLAEPQPTPNAQPQVPQRSVAKKSTATQQKQVNPVAPASVVSPFLPPQVDPPASKVVYFKPRSINKPRLFAPHTCSPKCNDHITYQLHKLNGYNPLSKPLLCGWNRLMIKAKTKKHINYKAPCGRVLRNMEELHSYLRKTDSNFTVDLFDFDHWVQCLAEFVLDKCLYSIKDISNGLEEVAIPLINYVNNEQNGFLNYSTQRRPQKGVNLNLDQEFLVGCDCEDDCSDKSKCTCWQLTIDGQRSILKDINPDDVGYHYRRLLEQVNTGIYECNSRCKCNNTCLNRVVQHPLQLKLQVFQTTNRGWGIRCLNDVPQGTFICIYAGSLLTDHMANEGGQTYGDEYLAELDYIEVVERLKEDYEDEAYKSEEDVSSSTDKEDEEFDPRKAEQMMDDSEYRYYDQTKREQRESTIRTRHQRKKIEESSNNSAKKTDDKKPDDKKEAKGKFKAEKEKPKIEEVVKEEKPKEETTVKEKDSADAESEWVTISDDEDVVREPSSFNPKSLNDDSKPKRYQSVREMFGKDEAIYIMDAKNSGNIGRFLNHSCSPNVFVQNVFVDTHDLRFPWVAFFALTYIRAGTELTWNYNYDVGSVKGKVMYCHCGSMECRGRLL